MGHLVRVQVQDVHTQHEFSTSAQIASRFTDPTGVSVFSGW